MSETEQLYLPLQTESSHTDNGFYDSLNFIRENANSQYGVGKVFERQPLTLQEHQQKAYDDVINGFKESDRGKLIMACGTRNPLILQQK